MLLAHPMVDPAARKVLSGQPDVAGGGKQAVLLGGQVRRFTRYGLELRCQQEKEEDCLVSGEW